VDIAALVTNGDGLTGRIPPSRRGHLPCTETTFALSAEVISVLGSHADD
jgi:hypothetical protein